MDKYLKLIADDASQGSLPPRASSFRADEFKAARPEPNASATVTPNSRHPILSPAIRTVIEEIEADARAKGWPPELLWSAEFWGSPRGLAALLDEGDAIAEVTAEYIAILKTERNILRFQRRAS